VTRCSIDWEERILNAELEKTIFALEEKFWPADYRCFQKRTHLQGFAGDKTVEINHTSRRALLYKNNESLKQNYLLRSGCGEF